MVSRKDIERMSRSERIEAELKAAAEYGISPRRIVLLDSTFSAESSTPISFSAGSTLLPTRQEITRNDRDVQISVSEPSAVPDHLRPLLYKDSPEALSLSIERNLDKMNRSNRDQLIPVIAAQLRDLQIQTGDSEKVSKIQARVARAIFATSEFEDLHGEAGGALGPQE